MAFAYSLVKERPGQRARGTPSVNNRTQETEFRRQNVEFFLILSCGADVTRPTLGAKERAGCEKFWG